MSLAVLKSRALAGMAAPPVNVEVHLANGLPGWTIVGLPDTEVREAKDRVRAALQNSGFDIPPRRITINLAPADLPKESGRFDLPIALGILAASHQIRGDALARYEFAGELSLSGELRPIRGALAMAFAMVRAGSSRADAQDRAFILPLANADEAALVEAAEILPARTLLEVCAHFANAPDAPKLVRHVGLALAHTVCYPDFAEVKGQQHAKRALEVAAAGAHSCLLVGPPGAGKSMLAARLPGLLPLMSDAEALESAAVQSLAGGFSPQRWRQRPFRSPHHTTSGVALVGGGSVPRPGEVSLAHHGVLFLDELPEFDRRVPHHDFARGAPGRFSGALSAHRGDESVSVRLARSRQRQMPLHRRLRAALPEPHLGAPARSHRYPVAGSGTGAGEHGRTGRRGAEQRDRSAGSRGACGAGGAPGLAQQSPRPARHRSLLRA